MNANLARRELEGSECGDEEEGPVGRDAGEEPDVEEGDGGAAQEGKECGYGVNGSQRWGRHLCEAVWKGFLKS